MEFETFNAFSIRFKRAFDKSGKLPDINALFFLTLSLIFKR